MDIGSEFQQLRFLLLAARPEPNLWQGVAATQLNAQIDELLQRLH
jgi:hypothetical protein